VLDLVMQGAQITLNDLGAHAHPGAPFGRLLAAALDIAMPPADRAAWTGPAADPSAALGAAGGLAARGTRRFRGAILVERMNFGDWS